jgi:hypothetical protein
MKVVVLSASRHRNCTLKDVAGGYGTVFTVGNSWFARLLEMAKRRIASIPCYRGLFCNPILKLVSEVAIKHNELNRLTQHLIASSITDCNYEKELGHRGCKQFGAKVGYFGTFAATVPRVLHLGMPRIS